MITVFSVSVQFQFIIVDQLFFHLWPVTEWETPSANFNIEHLFAFSLGKSSCHVVRLLVSETVLLFLIYCFVVANLLEQFVRPCRLPWKVVVFSLIISLYASVCLLRRDFFLTSFLFSFSPFSTPERHWTTCHLSLTYSLTLFDLLTHRSPFFTQSVPFFRPLLRLTLVEHTPACVKKDITDEDR